MGDESFYVFTLQSKNSLYLNFETALYRDIGDPLRFSYPADHPLASEFEEQMIALLKEWKGEGEYLSVHHPDEQGARDDAPDCTALMLMGAASGSIGEILFGRRRDDGRDEDVEDVRGSCDIHPKSLRVRVRHDPVRGKQDIDGEATTWEIDAKGIRDDDCAFLVVECKCHKSRIHQGILGNLAFSIIDAGGTGGVIVSPMDLQKGAKKIAASQNIVHVKLPANSTPENFIIKFLNKVFAQLTDKLVVSDVASCEVVPTPKPLEEKPQNTMTEKGTKMTIEEFEEWFEKPVELLSGYEHAGFSHLMLTLPLQSGSIVRRAAWEKGICNARFTKLCKEISQVLMSIR